MSGNPMFEHALTLRELKVGTTFIVWDMATGNIVATGVISMAIRVDSDTGGTEIKYVDSKGKTKKFPLEEFGAISNGDNGWSHRITVPATYIDRVDELPTIPQV